MLHRLIGFAKRAYFRIIYYLILNHFRSWTVLFRRNFWYLINFQSPIKINFLKKRLLSLNTTYQIWNGMFTRPIEKYFSISLCTVCMGRLDHVKRTLIQNIRDNEDYPELEFLLLNYNSMDGLDCWVQSEMKEFLESGRLKYYHTRQPVVFDFSHSKNVAFKLASGEIVYNVDADNFIGIGFASHLNKLANENSHKSIFGNGFRFIEGRIGFFKKEFIELLGGFDESFESFGHEDMDILERAWRLGFKLMWFDKEYFNRIEHGDDLRIANFTNKNLKDSSFKNRIRSFNNIRNRKYKANLNCQWGFVNDLPIETDDGFY